MKSSWYLELSDPAKGHHKYYLVEIRGTDVLLRWGRIDRDGVLHTVHAETQTEARAVARKKVRQKLRRGYEAAIPGQRRHLAPPPPAPDERQLPLQLPDRTRRRRPRRTHAAAPAPSL